MNPFTLKAAGANNETPVAPPIPRRIDLGTEQQHHFWDTLIQGQGHVLAEARAGAGKSSSCREGMWRLLAAHPSLRIRYAVYNRALADEFQRDLPPGVDADTSHRFGYRALKTAFRSRIEKNKTYLILDETPAARNLPRYVRKSIALLVGQAKNAGLVPGQPDLEERLRELVLYHDINVYGRTSLVTSWTCEVLNKSAEWVEIVDFDDMLWLAVLAGVSFPACDILFCDEAQDFNSPQRQLVGPLSGGGRVVVVGDPFQAINLFRGADEDSMPHLEADLLTEGSPGLFRCPLTVTFRCPHSHVALANQLVPDLTAHPSNPDGDVLEGLTVERMLDLVEAGDLVICPTNAPVVSACLKMIARRRPAYVRGRALGDQLVTILRGMPDVNTTAEASHGVEVWRSRELSRLALLDGVEDLVESVSDRADGLQAVLSTCSSPVEAEPLIGRIFSDERRSGVVTFSTVHRAKGDEAQNVYLIEAKQMASRREWQARQARNLRYVALTRSKHRLAFVQPSI